MLTLNNGHKIPQIGLGTYKVTGIEGIDIFRQAIDVGYRMFDTAFVYGNEALLGEAIRQAIVEGAVEREELFVTSKLGPSYHRPDLVKRGCMLSLEHLGLDYIDLYLIHTPVAMKYRSDTEFLPMDRDGKLEIDDEVAPLQTWQAMEDLQRKGFVESIGVSNFNEMQIKEIIEMGRIKPVVNQVECSVGFNQADMRNFCQKENILLMACRPLGKTKHWIQEPDFLYSSGLLAVAEKHGKSAVQIALRYLIEKGVVPIPKSSDKTRMKENLDVLNFKLDSYDVGVLETLTEQQRSMPLNWLKVSKHYPF